LDRYAHAGSGASTSSQLGLLNNHRNPCPTFLSSIIILVIINHIDVDKEQKLTCLTCSAGDPMNSMSTKDLWDASMQHAFFHIKEAQ
jgi:hypothetical protein